MSDSQNKRAQLRHWLAEEGRLSAADRLDDDRSLISERIISSLQISDLLLFIGRLRGYEVTVQEIQADAFHSINTLMQHFFKENRHV